MESIAVRWAYNFQTTNRMIERGRSSRRRRSEHTIKNYCSYVKLFCEAYMKIPDADECFEKLNQGDIKEVVDRFIDFLTEKRKVSNRTARSAFYAVRYWLKSNDIDIEPLEDIELPTSAATLVEDRAPTREEMKTVLKFANIRDQVAAMLSLTGGFRVGTMTSLTWGDVVLDPRQFIEPSLRERDHSHLPALIKVKRKMGRKAKQKFFTFITPETKKLLLQYRAWRERQGEVITEESMLIGSQKQPFGSRITVNSLQASWGRILKRAGLDEKSHTWNVLHLHTLRKFFRTQCENAGVKRSYWEFWMGHKGGYLDDSYFRANLKEHLNEYMKAIPQLAVMEAPMIEERMRKIEEYHKKLEAVGFTPEEIEEMRRLRILAQKAMELKDLKDLTPEEVAEILKKIKESEPETETNGDGPYNGLNSQKIVSESELEAMLAEGWRVAVVLPSGKIVVER